MSRQRLIWNLDSCGNGIHLNRGQRFFAFLFAVGLVLTIFLSTPGLVSSQQPTTRQELIAEIKQQAKWHVQQGQAKPEFVVKLYGGDFGKKFGLSDREIVQIYEVQFERLKTPRSPLEQLPGWVGIAIASVVASLITGFRQHLCKGIQKIWEWFYQRLAGIALLRNVSLRRYRQRVIEKHAKLFIPFRPQRPLEMDQIYVALKVAGSKDPQSVTGVRQELDASQAVRDYPRLMVTGAPGSGKTMLLKYLFLAYAQGKLLLPGRPVLVLLELHRLSNPKLTQEQLIQELVQAFERYGFPKAGGFVKQSLKQGQLMLLLDGLDEVNSTVRPHVAQCIKDLLSTYPDCRAIITCRTMVYSNEFNPPVTSQILDVVEFSDQQVQRFLGAWEAEMPPERSLEQLLQTLRDRPQIMELARNPLLLTIIAFLYTDTPFELPHSRAEFYEESTRFLLGQWHQDHNQYKTTEKQLVLQHLALYNQDNSAADEKDRRSLNYQTVLQEIQTVLPGLNRSADRDTQPILKEIVERSGLLLRLDGGKRYQFAHLTLQEYFAAEALRENEAGLLQRFKSDPGAWREVVKLWCGRPTDSTHLIEAVYQQDTMTGFECLADAVDVQESVAEQIINSFKDQIERAATEDSIAQAFGSVASNCRPRGQAVFQFLQQTLDDTALGTEARQGAANALSRTNLPRAVTVLTRHYNAAALNLRAPMMRMGNLVVPALGVWARSDPCWREAIDDLATIGTAEAARELVPFLWYKDSNKASQTAWHLGSLLALNPVEEGLRDFTLSETQRRPNALDWVWSPFQAQENSESDLLSITGRIADLLEQKSQKQHLLSFPLDPRLVIPLCGIALVDQVHLPKTLTAKAEFLLEKPGRDPDLEQEITQEVESLLGRPDQTHWGCLLSSLEPHQQLHLLARLINAPRLPLPEDWRQLNQPVKYDFKTGWHYRLVLMLTFMISLLALVGMALFLTRPEHWWASGFIGIAALVVITFWLFLGRGIEERLEPSTFIRFGLRGPLTFYDELRRLLKENWVWGGGRPLYSALAWAVAGPVTGALSLAVIGPVTVTLAWAVAGAGAGDGFWTGVLAGALAGAVALAGVLAVTVTGALALVGAWVGAGAGAGSWVGAVAGTVALAVAVAWAVGMAGDGAWALAVTVAAGYGVGVWGGQVSRKTSRFRFMAIFAFPFFFALPIIIIFSAAALSYAFQLPIAILIEFFIIGFCTVLWKRGQTLYLRSQNPLHGILEMKL